MIRLGTFYSVIMIHNRPVFSPKCAYFFLTHIGSSFGQEKIKIYQQAQCALPLQQRDVQNARSDKKYNKMMEGGEKHQYERMHLVIRTLNNRDCGIYIYELYECTLGCKVVKLILYLLPLLHYSQLQENLAKVEKKMNRREANIVLYSFPYSITQT